MDWTVNSVIEGDEETDSDSDENEIRQLDAMLEEAEIHVSDTGLPIAPTWSFNPSSQVPASLHLAVPSHISGNPDPIEFPGACLLSTSSQLSPSLYSSPQSEELGNLDSAVALNKTYFEKLVRLENVLGLRLRQCREKLSDLHASSNDLTERAEIFRYINCGRPYFRDQNNRPAPDNEDTIAAKAQMYDFTFATSVPGWTVRDKNQFTQVMTQISLDMRKEKYNERIFELKCSLANGDKKSIEKEIVKLQKERDALNAKMPFVQLALPLNEDYDWDLLANKLNRRHTAHEYKCLWKLYFHPSINKSTWKNTEHSMLQTLASANNYQDWDDIARKLNTGRTGYQCFVYFRTNMANACLGKKWSHEEVTYLRRLIDYFREDFYIPWGKIAAAMENRTKIQIYNKYMRMIEQRKGRFLPEEDAVILNCVERFGPNFRLISEYLSHRSLVQIRARYQLLNKMRISTVWSVDDDRKLVQLMSNQDTKTTFSNVTKFFPGRNRINIRSRYITLIKWMKKHPDLDLEHAPRRGARRLNHGQATDDLGKAIENLKNTLSTEVEVKKDRKKITRDSDEADIEDAIIATLVNERIRNQQQKKSSYEGVLALPNKTVVSNKQLDLTNLRKCLLFLGSTLDKDLFENSNYSKEYPNLGDTNQDVNLIKVKSYSRKQTVNTIVCNDGPDIWGNNILNSRHYVLPPHYATITGLKSLLSYVRMYKDDAESVNLPVLMRRNPLLKAHVDLLLERFYILFLWPMLLSNEGSTDFYNSKLCKIDSLYFKEPLPGCSTGKKRRKGHKMLNDYDNSEKNKSD